MSGGQITPKDIDKIICDWTMKTAHTFKEYELNHLVAHIFNSLLSDGNIHTMPDDGFHFESRFCFCNPKVIADSEKITQIIHNKHSEKGH